MNPAQIVLSRRIRKTPFEQRVFELGAKAFTTYNHMPLASFFSTPEKDYEHLSQHVQVWDVSCERQVEVVGPDALNLVELITPRDISKCEIGQCMYAPLVDEHGCILNDPIILKLAEDRFWISIADSGVLLWLKGIVYGCGYDVRVFEPDVSPLAIQGPKADDLLADLLGDHVRDIKFFWFIEENIVGTDVIIARSGWSGQGGFEIYLQDFSKGLELWDTIWGAGQKYNIGPGCPNLIDRIERGLLSFGSDITMESNPYECGLDRFLETSKDAQCMSREAMDAFARNGVQKFLAFLFIDGDSLISPRSTWNVLDENKNVTGIVTSLAFSKKYNSNIAFATINSDSWSPGMPMLVDIEHQGELRCAKIVNRSWELDTS